MNLISLFDFISIVSIMSSLKEKFLISKNFRRCGNNIWSEFSELVAQYNPVDLSMGFPDYPPPVEVTETFYKVVTDENHYLHQYTREFGHVRLVEIFSTLYSKFLNREINSRNEILTTASGCQALYVIFMGFIDTDDEVIIIEPYFDYYEILTNIAGGICKFVPLRLKSTSENDSFSSSEWCLDIKELQNAFTKNTKLFILNTPNNPLGKVFSSDELTVITDLCKKWNVVCVADEVYEFCVFDKSKHIRIASFPEMWERTVTVCCPGKTFGVTGWELGIAYGSEKLINNLKIVHQNLVGMSNTPIQESFAILYENETARLCTKDCLLTKLPKELQNKRDFMVRTITKLKMKPVIPDGGFFILADFSNLIFEIDLKFNEVENHNLEFAKWMIQNLGVAGIPMSTFYSESNKHLGGNLIRFCFLKKNETLEKFANILTTWRNNNLKSGKSSARE